MGAAKYSFDMKEQFRVCLSNERVEYKLID